MVYGLRAVASLWLRGIPRGQRRQVSNVEAGGGVRKQLTMSSICNVMTISFKRQLTICNALNRKITSINTP
jgi:hypothetical protein